MVLYRIGKGQMTLEQNCAATQMNVFPYPSEDIAETTFNTGK